MTARDGPVIARVLGEAFEADPLMSWMVRDEARRAHRLERLFRVTIARVWLPSGECYVTSDLLGAAMWLPSDGWKLGLLQQVRMLPASVLALGPEIVRMMRLDSLLETKHPHDPPHWYLNAMGVEPSAQGRGLGTALMAPVLERCDRDRVPAYLETSTPRARTLYERNGFEVVEEFPVEEHGPLIWRMWREPQGALRQLWRGPEPGFTDGPA